MANFTIGSLIEATGPADTHLIEIETAAVESRKITLANLLSTTSSAAVVAEIDANVDALITLSGVAENATDLGAFTGTTIPNANTVKAALQALETAVESVVVGAVDSDDVANVSTVSGAVVSDALESLQTSINGFTAISGSTAVGSWVQPTNTTFSAFQSAIAAAQASATITGVYLKAGNYDWSANTNFALTGNAVHVWAEPLAIISMPGANQTLGADLFLVRTNLFWRGGRFINGGNPFSIRDLATRVERIEIDNVTGTQLGSIFYHDLLTKNASADLGHVRISRCTVDNSNSGIHVRSGSNAINSSIVPDYFECWGNTFKVLDKYGIVWNRDDPPTNGAWEKISVCHIHHNHIEDLRGRTASVVTGWMCNFSAFRHGIIENNQFIDCANGNRIDVESLYSKSQSAIIKGNLFWNRLALPHEQTQGQLAPKGESAGAVATDFLIEGNYFITDTANNINCALWIQTSNIRFLNNIIAGDYTGGAINTQSSFQHRNIQIKGNKFYCPAVPGNGAYVSISGHFPRLQIEDNTFEMSAPSGTLAAIQVRSGSSAGLACDDVVIRDNKIYNLNTAATVRAVELWKNAGSMLDPTIIDNTAVECQQFLRIQVGVIGNKTHLKGNIARNRSTVLTAVSDNPGGNSTLQLRNSWQAGES